MSVGDLSAAPALASWISTADGPFQAPVLVLAALLVASALLLLGLLAYLRGQRRLLTEARRRLLEQQSLTTAALNALPFPLVWRDDAGAPLMMNTSCETLALPRARPAGDQLPTGHVMLPFEAAPLAPADDAAPRDIDYVDALGRNRSGRLWWRPVRLGSQRSGGTIGVLQDTTEASEHSRRWQAVEQNLHALTEHVPVVFFTARRPPQGAAELPFVVGDLPAMAGLDPHALLAGDDPAQDPSLLERVHPEDLGELVQLLERVRHAGSGMPEQALDFRVYAPQGPRWIHLAMAPQPSPDGALQWSGYLLDTSGTNARNESLRAARDAAERASKAKADFLATMSHEIRTPMNGVIGMLELLAHTELTSEQHELLHAVEDSANVLLQILDDVLDFSKLEVGNLRLVNEPFDPRTLVDHVVGVMAAHMHRKGLRIDVAVDAAVAAALVGDGVRIRQILLNLLSNAGKFTEHGRITVSWRVVGDDGAGQRLRLAVRDTGVGIAQDKQAALFTPFNQAEAWTARRYGGTGLGLAICRHLVQLMGGTIALTSKPGEGTEVAVELYLPIDRREQEPSPQLVDRHAIVRLGEPETAAALAGHLAALGLTTEIIPPGQPLRTGIAANLLFVDEDDHRSDNVIAAKLVAVSGQPMPVLAGPDERMVLGANPLKWGALKRLCAQALGSLDAVPFRPAGPPWVAAGPGAPPRQARPILVAEDHPVSQQLVRRQLDLLGWDCDVVANGREALDALRRKDYAMLLTDCNMPLMSGYELASAWRQHEEREAGRRTRLPIVAMTAHTLGGELARCHDAGMDDCLSKPVQLRLLQQKIASWLPREASMAVAAPDDGGGSADPQDSPAPLALPPPMLQLLVQTTQADLAQLAQALSAADFVAVEQRLHRVLGALQLCGDDPSLADGRRWLERRRADPASIDRTGLSACIEGIQRVLQRLEQASVDATPGP
ncbi:MAG: response regulator [Xanthomonadaceae bacterium]|nr:response regulator [Xanthomonadaceae bacterium]